MNRSKLLNISLFLIILILLFACEKDRTPRLIVTVQEEDGTAAVGATVRAHPGDVTDSTGVAPEIDPQMDQTTTTDGQGNAIFNFPYSAVLDIDVTYVKATDTLTAHGVAKIEVVRQRDEENNYNETVTVK